MNKIVSFLLISSVLCATALLFTESTTVPDSDIESIIAKMTLEEKVGQMTNLTISTIVKEKSDPVELDMDKVRDVIVKHHVGSIQNVVDHAYTLEEWHKIITQLQDVTLKETRVKIPFLYCIDAVHGANYTIKSTLFPHNIGMAATRNPALVKKCAEITAKEVRASGIRYNFSPVLDVGRQPLWPRFGETFGEDVYLVKAMGTASIRGYEGKKLSDVNAVASCMKHFLGYSVPATGRDRASASIPDITLREYFLPPFKAAVDSGAHTLMVNSADVNGIPVHASKYLLTNVLRKELGFKGVVISDWEDIKKLHERHKVADSHKQAVFLAVEAGIDMCIVPFDFSFSDQLIELVKEGRISEERINESVRRILQLKKDLGLWETPYVEKQAIKNFGLPEYQKVSLEAARESITLLKNTKNSLPLEKGKKILVVGPTARSLTSLHGSWSYTWQGTKSDYFSKDVLNVFRSIEEKAQAIHMDDSYFLTKKGNEDLKFIPDVSAIVVCIGEDAYAETPGNISDLELEARQLNLVKELAKFEFPMVLVLLEGRPRIIREIEPMADGIVMAYWPGPQGGKAIADVLFGDYNPNGKLPFTYPKYSGDLKTYDHRPLDIAVEQVVPEYKYFYQFDPQWEFGHGLSYTTFEYSDLKLSASQIKGNESLKVSVTVKNTGKRSGKETVELYSKDLFASVAPPVKRLRGFKKISLEPGGSQVVSFEINKSDLAFVGQDLFWITEPGDFEVMVGGLKENFKYLE